MSYYCSAVGCSSNYHDKLSNISFHKIPKNPDIAAVWKKSIGRNDNVKRLYLCSLHFDESCFDKSHEMMQRLIPNKSKRINKKLLPNSVPTIFSYQHNQSGAAYDNDKGILLCDYCQSTVERNRFGQHEELLICKDCGNKAHPSCLSYSAELVEQIRSDGSWQCIDCKACIICEGTGDPDTLLFCDACDKGYHMNCHEPKLKQMPSGKWACANCKVKGKLRLTTSTTKPVYIIADDDESPKNKGTKLTPTTLNLGKDHYSAPQTSITSIAQVHPPLFQNSQSESAVGHSSTVVVNKQPAMQSTLGKGVHNNLTHILNPKVPLPDVRSSIREDVLKALPLDVADWTTEDVAYYFKSHGYTEEGALLQEQEIDGRALLLMSRNDCLTGMRIKLGPALKIYHMHIYKLQSRTDFLG